MYSPSHTHAHDDDFLFEQQRDPSDPRFRPVEYAAPPPPPSPVTSPASKDDSLSAATLQPIAVDIKRAAEMLCTSRWQIRQLLYSGKLSAFKLGKKYLIRISDLQAFVDEQARQARQE
jgi:excisionase family DNA binding protein